MHRYNICNRLITGELLYLSKHQQWVSDVTQAVTLHAGGAQARRIDERADAGMSARMNACMDGYMLHEFRLQCHMI